MLLEGESTNKISDLKLDEFYKGGNCKLQEGALLYIEKTSMGKFNIGGNCKLQFPEFFLSVKHFK